MFSPDVTCPSSRKDGGTEHGPYIMIKSLQCKAKDTKAEDGEILTATIPNHKQTPQNLIYYFSYFSMNTNFAPSPTINHSIPQASFKTLT